MSFLLSHILSSTKLEKRAEQVLLGRERGGEREGVGDKGKRCPRRCLHI
jgi:hypothetical protein